MNHQKQYMYRTQTFKFWLVMSVIIAKNLKDQTYIKYARVYCVRPYRSVNDALPCCIVLQSVLKVYQTKINSSYNKEGNTYLTCFNILIILFRCYMCCSFYKPSISLNLISQVTCIRTNALIIQVSLIILLLFGLDLTFDLL